MGHRARHWVKFSLRWGIALAGVWYVAAKISLYDRVTVAGPNGWPQSLRLAAPATESDSVFSVLDESGALRSVARAQLLCHIDQEPVKLKSGGGHLWDVLALHPGAGGEPARLVITPHRVFLARLLGIEKSPAVEVAQSDVLSAASANLSYPPVEIGLFHMVHDARTSLLLAALLVLPLTFLITSFRWHELLRGLDIHIGQARVFMLNMVGSFYNTFLPGSTGGDLFKAYYASKQTPFRMRAVMSVVVDRVIGLLALIIFGGTMAALQWHVPACRKIALGSAAILLATAGGLLVFYRPRLRRLSGLDFVLKRLPLQHHVASAVEVMHMYADKPGLVLLALVVSLPVHATTVTSAMLAGEAFGLPLSAAYYWAIVPVIVLSGSIPISPQGVGVMEGMGVLLTRSRCNIGQVLALTMSIRLGAIFWNLLGGVFVARGGFHVPPAGAMDQPDDAPA